MDIKHLDHLNLSMMQKKHTETTVTIMDKAASRGSIVATDVKASSIRQRKDVTEETTCAQQTAKGKAKDTTEVVPVDVGQTQARAEESWVLVTNKKVRKNTTYISGTAKGMPGALQVAVRKEKRRCLGVFLSRLDPETTEEMVKDHISRCSDLKVEVKKIVTKYDTYSSFFIGTDYKHVKNLLAPDIWPQGALIKRYYESKQ